MSSQHWERFVFAALFAAVLAGFVVSWFTPGYDTDTDLIGEVKPPDSVPPSLERFAVQPDEGTMISLPPVPIVKSPESALSENHLFNASFETGQNPWTVAGSTLSGTPTDLLAAEGNNAFQLIPPVGDFGTLFQLVKLAPRTLYVLSALLFNPEGATVVLEARDSLTAAEVVEPAEAHASTAWEIEHLTFCTGAASRDVSVGIRCSAKVGSTAVLVDSFSLYPLPAQNFFPDNSINPEPDPDVAPTWYMNGKSAPVVTDGYESSEALGMPLYAGRGLSLVGLVPIQAGLVGRKVLVSAMVKCEFEEGRPPDVVLSLRLSNSDSIPSQSPPQPGSTEWSEIAIIAVTPEIESNTTPFFVVGIEISGRSSGRVLVDDVVVLGVPEDFSGGLAVAQR